MPQYFFDYPTFDPVAQFLPKKLSSESAAAEEDKDDIEFIKDLSGKEIDKFLNSLSDD